MKSKKLKLLRTKYNKLEALRDEHKKVADIYNEMVHKDNNDLMKLRIAIYNIENPTTIEN